MKNPKIVNEVADTGVADVNIVDARVVYIGIASRRSCKMLRSHYTDIKNAKIALREG